MKIETVKWSWADAVKSKNVYRDDEFVRSKSKEEALKAVDFLMGKARGLTYTITVSRDGEYFTYWRHSMPCLGGLVKYRDSHGDRYYMNPVFPRDIYVAFPEGEITFISCQRSGGIDGTYLKFILSQESPWVSAFGTQETILFRSNHFVLTNMNTDPTVFYSLMRMSGFAGYYSAPQYKNWNPKAECLATKTMIGDPRRLAGQKPLRISGGTWADGYGYTRPYNESIFKTSIPHTMAEFANLPGYPQVSYTDTYFKAEMKKTFGVDFRNGVKPDKDNEKILTEAWDYFKEQSKELPDEPGEKWNGKPPYPGCEECRIVIKGK